MNFLITTQIKQATGFQQFTVEANNEKEAIAKHLAGLSQFSSEQIEVTKLGKITIERNE